MSNYDNFFKQVGDFHAKFELPTAYSYYGEINQDFKLKRDPQFLTIDNHLFRRKFMQEELEEFDAACAVGDLPKAADALVDLVYVVLGTAHLMGLPFNELWEAVQAANMAKERAVANDARSKRGHRLDVVKPEGWVAPPIAEILEKAGWKNPDKVEEKA